MRVELPTWLPPLADLNFGRAQRKDVADTKVFFFDAVGRDVLAKPSGAQLRAKFRLFAPPDLVVVGRVVMNSLLETTVNTGIGLLVVLETERSENLRTVDQALADGTRLSTRPPLFNRANENPGDRAFFAPTNQLRPAPSDSNRARNVSN